MRPVPAARRATRRDLRALHRAGVAVEAIGARGVRRAALLEVGAGCARVRLGRNGPWKKSPNRMKSGQWLLELFKNVVELSRPALVPADFTFGGASEVYLVPALRASSFQFSSPSDAV